MRSKLKWVLLSVWVLELITGCIATFSCDESVRSQSKSPDGRYVASVSTRDCGATASAATIVNVIKEPEFLHSFHEIFVVTHESDLAISWRNEKVLLVRVKGGEVFHQAESWKDISVVIERLP
jgi:hypothetical protein